jgi:exonuclease SbcD
MTTSAFRLAHFADTHLGYRALGKADPLSGRNQRAVDVEHAFEAAVDEILARRVDLVIHAGDVFHHTRPSWSSLRCFVRQMRRLEAAGLPTVVIGGNHDTPRLRTTGSVFSLLEMALPDTRFVAGYELEEVRLDRLNLTIHAVPHGALTNPNPAFPLVEPGKRNLLVTHGLAPGVHLRGQHEAGEERLGAELLGADFDYVALGHFHLWGDQGRNAWYSGSTERFGWGDEPVSPGFLDVTISAVGDPPAVEHVDLPARPMKTLNPLIGEDRPARELADTILDRLQALAEPDAMVRIELKQTPRPVRRETDAILRREAADLVWSVQVYSPADILEGFKRTTGDEPLADLRTLFSAFVAEQSAQAIYDPPFAASFGERGARALDAAAQTMAATAGEEPA